MMMRRMQARTARTASQVRVSNKVPRHVSLQAVCGRARVRAGPIARCGGACPELLLKRVPSPPHGLC